MSSVDQRPPCIVWGLETQIGLNIVRELGRAGVRVVGITHDARAIGLKSRYLWRSRIVSQPCSQELTDVLIALGEELGDCCLLTVSENNLKWLSDRPGAFGRIRPVLPPAEALRTVLDKRATLSIAQGLGIVIPQTVQPESLAHAQQIAATFPFPAVLKWSDPTAMAPILRRHGMALRKAEYAYTGEEFLAIAGRYAPIGAWPLVQQYCEGQGLGQFFYMHEGQAIRRFQHRRIAEWPPEGGFSSVCDAVPLDQHAALQMSSIALLQAIGWSGVAMVEYRYNPRTGVAALMEINGRYWGSFPLAVHCRAGFALLSYRLHSGLQPLPLPTTRDDLRSRMVFTELKRLQRMFFAPHLIEDKNFRIRKAQELWRFLSDFFSPRVRYYVWSITDCRPSIADLVNSIGKLLGPRKKQKASR